MTSLAINTDDLSTQREINPATTPAGSLQRIVYKQHGQTEIQSWLFIIPQLTNQSFHLEIKCA